MAAFLPVYPKRAQHKCRRSCSRFSWVCLHCNLSPTKSMRMRESMCRLRRKPVGLSSALHGATQRTLALIVQALESLELYLDLASAGKSVAAKPSRARRARPATRAGEGIQLRRRDRTQRRPLRYHTIKSHNR